jgi:hypothetical protein
MEIMKIGGILFATALGLWIIKSLFDWWGERRESNEWQTQYKADANAWDGKHGEGVSNDKSEDDQAPKR